MTLDLALIVAALLLWYAALRRRWLCAVEHRQVMDSWMAAYMDHIADMFAPYGVQPWASAEDRVRAFTWHPQYVELEGI